MFRTEMSIYSPKCSFPTKKELDNFVYKWLSENQVLVLLASMFIFFFSFLFFLNFIFKLYNIVLVFAKYRNESTTGIPVFLLISLLTMICFTYVLGSPFLEITNFKTSFLSLNCTLKVCTCVYVYKIWLFFLPYFLEIMFWHHINTP